MNKVKKRKKPVEDRIHELGLDVVSSVGGSGHSIGITDAGIAYLWGRNSLGQLGIGTSGSRIALPRQAELIQPDSDTTISTSKNARAVRGFVGGFSDAGHSAILDSAGYLWFSGCDRWQQLGLGSSNAGSSGYTWENGKLWQERFQRNDFLMELLKSRNRDIGWLPKDSSSLIRDVAIGGDHTVVLSSNMHDVITFGKGAEGQLGIANKPFVNAPTISKELSTPIQDDRDGSKKISAVCAIDHCSMTLDEQNNVINMVGKCRHKTKEFHNAFRICQERSRKYGLVENG